MSQEKTAWLRAWLSALYGKQLAFRYILGKKSRSRNLSYSFVLQYFGLQWLCFLLPSCDSLVCRLAALAMQDDGLNLDQTLESQVGLEAHRRSSKCSLSSHFQSSACLCKVIVSVPHTKRSLSGFLFTSGQALHQDATALIPVLRVTANAVIKFRVVETSRRIT